MVLILLFDNILLIYLDPISILSFDIYTAGLPPALLSLNRWIFVLNYTMPPRAFQAIGLTNCVFNPCNQGKKMVQYLDSMGLCKL